MRRFRSELETEGAFSQVPFDYDSIKPNSLETESQPATNDANEEQEYVVPEGLSLPTGLNVPKSMKDHQLIEKTALFISKNAQMEIILKIKQDQNPLFSFLNMDSPMNQYFKYILSVIRSGKYIPKIEDVPEKPEESESDDEGYLHPSLFASSKPSISKTCQSHTETSVLKQILQSLGSESDTDDSKTNTPLKNFSLLPPPPPEVETVIEKLAEKVAQVGEEFESSVRSRGDSRFDFLSPGHCFHAHYVKRKIHYLQQKHMKEVTESIVLPLTTVGKERPSSSKSKKLSFTVKKMSEDRLVSGRNESIEDEDDEITNLIEAASTSDKKTSSKDELKDKLASAARDRLKQDKKVQEERKKKAALFLEMIRKKEEDKSKSDKSVLPFTTKDETIKKTESRGSDRSSRSSKEHKRKRRSRSRDRHSRDDKKRHRSRSR